MHDTEYDRRTTHADWAFRGGLTGAIITFTVVLFMHEGSQAAVGLSVLFGAPFIGLVVVFLKWWTWVGAAIGAASGYGLSVIAISVDRLGRHPTLPIVFGMLTIACLLYLAGCILWGAFIGLLIGLIINAAPAGFWIGALVGLVKGWRSLTQSKDT